MLNAPVTSHGGVSRAGVSVTSQHLEGGRLAGSIDSQQTEALAGQSGDGQSVWMRTQKKESIVVV